MIIIHLALFLSIIYTGVKDSNKTENENENENESAQILASVPRILSNDHSPLLVNSGKLA